MPRHDNKLNDDQIRALLAAEDGSTLPEIATRLGWHRGTVASRLSQAYIRLGVAHLDREDRRAAALRAARRNKLIPPGKKRHMIEPKIGDTVLYGDEPLKIVAFCEDYGTRLDDGRWVCSSQFTHLDTHLDASLWRYGTPSATHADTRTRLRTILASAIRDAAYSCTDESCPLTEEECYEQHPILEAGRGRGVIISVVADPEALADVAIAALFTSKGHVYLSTGCLHDEHEYCQRATGHMGLKQPGECKWCNHNCICSCHTKEEGNYG